jgi:hypothetical protein
MKNLFNDISQEEKSRILEMHSGKKNVIIEQGYGVAGDRFRDSTSVWTHDNRLQGFTGKSSSLPAGGENKFISGCGDVNLPQGNVQTASKMAKSFVDSIGGVDISGKGSSKNEATLLQMKNLSIIDFNEVLRQYCKLPKKWKSKGLYNDLSDEVNFRWSKGNTTDLEKYLVTFAKEKIEKFCSNYSKKMTYTDKYNKESGLKTVTPTETKFCSTYYKYS